MKKIPKIPQKQGRHCHKCVTPGVYQGRMCTNAGTLLEIIEDTDARRVYLCPKCLSGEVIIKNLDLHGWWYQNFEPTGDAGLDEPIQDYTYYSA